MTQPLCENQRHRLVVDIQVPQSDSIYSFLSGKDVSLSYVKASEDGDGFEFNFVCSNGEQTGQKIWNDHAVKTIVWPSDYNRVQIHYG